MLVHRLRRCTNIKPALDERIVFAGTSLHHRFDRNCFPLPVGFVIDIDWGGGGQHVRGSSCGIPAACEL